MADRRPTHILSSYYAPRGHNRMFDLGQQIAQMYLSPAISSSASSVMPAAAKAP